MKELFAYLFCGFWGHDIHPEKLEQIIKTDSRDTANYRDVCKRCGHIGETYGITHVGPFSFEFPKEPTK